MTNASVHFLSLPASCGSWPVGRVVRIHLISGNSCQPGYAVEGDPSHRWVSVESWIEIIYVPSCSWDVTFAALSNVADQIIVSTLRSELLYVVWRVRRAINNWEVIVSAIYSSGSSDTVVGQPITLNSNCDNTVSLRTRNANFISPSALTRNLSGSVRADALGTSYWLALEVRISEVWGVRSWRLGASVLELTSQRLALSESGWVRSGSSRLK